jgi:hypothetical protein
LVVELPDPPLPAEPDEPEPVAPLPAPVLGEVVELPELELPELELPLAPEPDLLKWASHSEREIWPSLFLSTDENVGGDMLELLEDELCAIATPDRARSAAAVALVTSFNID